MKNKIVKLELVCEKITDGVHNTPKLESSGIPMLDSTNIDNFLIDDSNPKKFISQETDKALSTRCKPQPGDILLSSRGSIGKIAVVKKGQDFNIMGNIILLRTDPKLLDNRYLALLLFGSRTQIENLARGVAQKGLYLNDVRNLEIPLPLLEEQQRIASVLDKADRLRQLDRQLVAKYDQLTQSVFLEMFGDPVRNEKGWKQNSLGNVSEIVSGVTKGRCLPGKMLVSAPYIRVANVQDGHLDLKEIKVIEVPDYEITKYGLQYGDLLLTEGGDPDKLRRGAIWKNQIVPCIHQNHIFRVRPNLSIISPEYLCTLIASAYGKKYFLKAAKQTTGIATINSTQLKKFLVYLPPLALQTRFAEIIERIERQKAKAEESLQKSEALFQALLQRAFKGELFENETFIKEELSA